MTINIVSRDGTYFVLNRAALRSEVIDFMFVDGMEPAPTLTELYPRTRVDSSGIDIGDDHWALAQTSFAARPNLHNFLTADARSQLASAVDTRDASQAGPSWVPTAIWSQFLTAGQGVHRYARASRLNTDIILINRDQISGYAEMPTDDATVRRMLQVAPPSMFERLIGIESGEQARARWLPEINRRFNALMWSNVNQGMGAGAAMQSYRDTVHRQFVEAYLPLIGGSTAAHPGGAAVGAGLRAMGWI
ncbi:MAG: hypothetical protein ACJA06_001413 [Halocynthiibacter sp.]|jgi:hypothetical protein